MFNYRNQKKKFDALNPKKEQMNYKKPEVFEPSKIEDEKNEEIKVFAPSNQEEEEKQPERKLSEQDLDELDFQSEKGTVFTDLMSDCISVMQP